MAPPPALGFGLMIIVLLLIGGVTAYATSQFAARVSHLGMQNTRRTAHVAAIEEAVRQLRGSVPPFIAAADAPAREAIAREMDQRIAEIDQNILFLSGGARSKHEADELAEFARAYRQYLDSRPRWLELCGAGQTEEAAQWRSRTMLPAGAAMELALLELGRLTRASSDAVEQQATAEARSLRILLIGGLAVALLVGVTAAVAISRGVAPRLGQAACAGGQCTTTARS